MTQNTPSQEVLEIQKIVERSSDLGPYEVQVRQALVNWDDFGGGGLRWAARVDPVKQTPGEPAEIIGVMLDQVYQSGKFTQPFVKAPFENRYDLPKILETLRQEGHVKLSADKTEATLTSSTLARIIHSSAFYQAQLDVRAQTPSLPSGSASKPLKHDLN